MSSFCSSNFYFTVFLVCYSNICNRLLQDNARRIECKNLSYIISLLQAYSIWLTFETLTAKNTIAFIIPFHIGILLVLCMGGLKQSARWLLICFSNQLISQKAVRTSPEKQLDLGLEGICTNVSKGSYSNLSVIFRGRGRPVHLLIRLYYVNYIFVG